MPTLRPPSRKPRKTSITLGRNLVVVEAAKISSAWAHLAQAPARAASSMSRRRNEPGSRVYRSTGRPSRSPGLALRRGYRRRCIRQVAPVAHPWLPAVRSPARPPVQPPNQRNTDKGRVFSVPGTGAGVRETSDGRGNSSTAETARRGGERSTRRGWAANGASAVPASAGH